MIGQTFCYYLHSKEANQIIYCQLNLATATQGFPLAQGAATAFSKTLVGAIHEETFSPRKLFSVVFCSTFRVKMPSSSGKAASMPISLAAARLAVTSCTFSASSSYKGSLHYLHLKGSQLVTESSDRQTDNTLSCSLARRISKISESATLLFDLDRRAV